MSAKTTLGRLKARVQAAMAEAQHLPRTLRLVWGASKGLTLAWGVILFIQGLKPVATVYLIKLVVNAVVAAADAGGAWPQVKEIIFLAIPLGSILLLSEVLNGLMRWVRTVQAHRVSMHISDLIQRKNAAADMSLYETTEFYDLMHQARYESASRPLALLDNMGTFLQSGITLVGLLAILIPLGAWIPLVLLVQTLPTFYTLLHFAQLQFDWRIKATPAARRAEYFDSIFNVSNTAGELRMFGTASYFQESFRQLREWIHRGDMDLMRRQSIMEFFAGLGALAVTASSLAWVVWQTVTGALQLGDLVLFYQALNYGQQILRGLLGNAEQTFTNLLFIGKLYEFLALKPRVVSPADPKTMPTLQDSIRFESVSFKYPGSDRFALEDCNMEIPAGKLTAILGENGSGKSTLVKLLSRFYDPEKGRVTIDGTDLRELDLDTLRGQISPVFQSPVRYCATARENIALSDLSKKENQDHIETAAKGAGVHDIIDRLPGGYDCLLGKGFERGMELSGGEWQRVALARAFLRLTPIWLLDEPTSAMDSWTEIEWLDRFQRLAEGRTSIIVTHRLSAAKRADIIFVMQHGKVVEAGSHTELLERQGMYAASWTAQGRSS